MSLPDKQLPSGEFDQFLGMLQTARFEGIPLSRVIGKDEFRLTPNAPPPQRHLPWASYTLVNEDIYREALPDVVRDPAQLSRLFAEVGSQTDYTRYRIANLPQLGVHFLVAAKPGQAIPDNVAENDQLSGKITVAVRLNESEKPLSDRQASLYGGVLKVFGPAPDGKIYIREHVSARNATVVSDQLFIGTPYSVDLD